MFPLIFSSLGQSAIDLADNISFFLDPYAYRISWKLELTYFPYYTIFKSLDLVQKLKFDTILFERRNSKNFEIQDFYSKSHKSSNPKIILLLLKLKECVFVFVELAKYTIRGES